MEGMTLHKINQEIQAVEDMEKRIIKAATKPYHKDTTETLRLLHKAKMRLEVHWWDRLTQYTG